MTAPRDAANVTAVRLVAIVAVALCSGCSWLARSPAPPPTGGAWSYMNAAPQGELPPPHIVAAARENLSTSPGAPACVEPFATGPSARQRCASIPTGTHRVSCRAECVRRHLPDEASQARVGGLVAVRYTLTASGRFEDTTTLHDPGCGLGRAAPDALRACCEVEPEGVTPSGLAGVEGCHVIEFTSAE